MNKIYRIFAKGDDTATAVGLLQNETATTYTFRVQQGANTTVQIFDKNVFEITSILETAEMQTYHVNSKNADNESVSVELLKSCFGGCA